ncbi:type II CRISPR RNA-guided endonuclease Cas9 [Companilactobacillus hulinensis]|uniref:type II CRISPR RNA-guided endonuclease Cas9 n=1 Tax=Companilactobacillus hulinensis TaxID=2486007 RepID=UPI000F7B9C85|nr:type II CRISPR RNA-guided endonuclease Cas9 [Companilactobacillus hulinensis]
MNRKKTIYNIGLDIGTGSVGWAVIDDNYALLHAKKQNLWGVRLFDQAQTAEKTRKYRSSRRRYKRKRNRLNWLDEIFSDELFKVDPGFLNRTRSSWVSPKDESRTRDKYNLFIDKNFNDQTYYKQYPTIFHLRKNLIENSKKADIRLVYLAIHNIIKYRGNFTHEYQNYDVSNMQTGLKDTLISLKNELIGSNFEIEYTNLQKINDILLDKNERSSDKSDKAVSFIKTNNKNTTEKIKTLLRLILGLSVDIRKIFEIDTTEKIDLQFLSKKSEEQLIKLNDFLDDTQLKIISIAQSLNSIIVLNDILGKETYLSNAMVKKYDIHHDQLAHLKSIWLTDPNTNEVKKARGYYNEYINGKDTSTDFESNIKKYLKVVKHVDVTKIDFEVANHQYLLKQRNSNSGVIPFQLNRNELVQILSNQEKYFPFLKENKNKIISLLEFRIPYYVGPLQDRDKNRFAWMTRKSSGPIRPWNFDEKVDREKSSTDFIKCMTSTDPFLIGEPVIPKNSLIYQKFEVLNELNKIKISNSKNINDAQPLTVNTKKVIFNELFKKQKSVSSSTLKKWLVRKSLYTDPHIFGLSDPKKFLSGLSTYHDLLNIFDDTFVDDLKNLKFLEELIEWQTIFEDRNILKIKLNGINSLKANQIDRLSKTRYKGWGNFSKKMLMGMSTNCKIPGEHTSSNHNVLELMWETNDNLMQVIHSTKYTFEEQIKIQNSNIDNLSTTDLIENIHISPALKRGVKQALLVIDDLVKFMGHQPKNIFIEFTRDSMPSKKTESRYKKIAGIYNALEEDPHLKIKKTLYSTKNLKNLLDENKDNLSDDRYYLYFMQLGRSLYSNEVIDLNNLFTGKYQIDHILPRSYTPDNSLDNKALVSINENQRKSSSLLLPDEVIKNNITRWMNLKNTNLMSSKKFNNLTRTEVSSAQQKDFVKRQLVQTSQIIKNVAAILNEKYTDTKIIETRASMGTEFRKSFSDLNYQTFHYKHPELVKNRELNDYHHAQDAYICSVVGLYQLKKYPKNELNIAYGEYSKFFESLKKEAKKHGNILPKYARNNFIIGSMKSGNIQTTSEGEVIWTNKIKNEVLSTFKYRQYLTSRRTFIRDGELFGATIQSASNKKLVPLSKNKPTEIYGGYTSEKTSYMSLVTIGKKTKLINIPVRIAHEIEMKHISLNEWLTKEKTPVKVLIAKIPINQLIESPRYGLISLSAASEQSNAKQLTLPFEQTALLALLNKSKKEKHASIIRNFDEEYLYNIYIQIIEKIEKQYPIYSSQKNILINAKEEFLSISSDKKIEVINSLISFLRTKPKNTNIKIGNITKNRFERTQKKLDLSNFNFIYQSPTGLYNTKIHIN